MRKIRIALLLIVIMVVTSCLWQVEAVELEVDGDMEIMVDTPLKASIKQSTYQVLSSNEVALEENYNLKDHLSKINIKNQKKSSACWAFSFSTILETSIAKQHNKVSKEYSPMHIEYVTSQMFNRAVGSGAGPRLSVAYCVSGHGPVEESQMPFTSVYDDATGFKDSKDVGNLDKAIAGRIRETIEFSSIYKKINNHTIQYYTDSACKKLYTSNDLEVGKKLIKQHIKNYGAISADVYMDEAKYYNPSTASYHYNDYENRKQPNHVVSIVGWDDDYSVDHFKEGSKPLHKGAYIALNSYGTDWGNGGYLYISYEDACVEEGLIGITNIQEYENNKKDYDKIYQYDELGMNIGIPLGGQSVYASNQYTRQMIADKDEMVQEVGLYIARTSEVEVYINPDSADIQKAKLVAKPNEALETGYHTVKLAQPIKLTGNQFAIKVKYTNQEGAYIPMEVNYKTFGLGNTSYFFDSATAKDGEGFISKDGSNWSDVNKTVINSGGKQYNLANASNCIKVFTTYHTKTQSSTTTSNDSNKLEQGVAVDKTVTNTVQPKGNTVDDIYVGNDNHDNNQIYVYDTKNMDSTTANKVLPFAGNHLLILIAFVLFVLVAIMVYIRLRCLKDVK